MIQEDNNMNRCIHKGAVKTVIAVLVSIKVSFRMRSVGLNKKCIQIKISEVN